MTLATATLPRPSTRGSEPIPVAITGVGLITPLGASARQTWQALLAGRYITDHSRAAGDWNQNPEHSRAAQMAIRAANEAITDARWLPSEDTAIVVGTSKGSIERWLTPAPQAGRFAPQAGGFLDTQGLADIASTLADLLNLRHAPKLTISTACASGLVALIRAALLIQSRQVHRALVVAAEASVHPLFLGSFERLGVLPKPGAGCRPFDHHRDGFLMTEAAAAVCLESASATPQPSPQVLIDRYALAADASHLTAIDPDGRVLRHLIRQVAADHPIDLIHAHGTGTTSNDPIELAAIESVISQSVIPQAQTPSLYSHKAALGHSLGAAGLISVVINCLAHQHSTIPGNIRTANPLPTSQVQLSPIPLHRPVNRSIALAAGFGGAAASISLISP